MTKKHFSIVARVDTDSPAAARSVLEKLVAKGSVREGSNANELVVESEMYGQNAKDLNRSLLSALRRVEKKTRLRAEWSSGGTTERFFDYVSKGVRKNRA